jgi:hypothetical protein
MRERGSTTYLSERWSLTEAIRRQVLSFRLAFVLVLRPPAAAVVLLAFPLVARLHRRRLRLVVRLLRRLQLRDLLLRRVLLLGGSLCLRVRGDAQLLRLHLLLLLQERGGRRRVLRNSRLRSTWRTRRCVGDVLEPGRAGATIGARATDGSSRSAGRAGVVVAGGQAVLPWRHLRRQERNSSGHLALCRRACHVSGVGQANGPGERGTYCPFRPGYRVARYQPWGKGCTRQVVRSFRRSRLALRTSLPARARHSSER